MYGLKFFKMAIFAVFDVNHKLGAPVSNYLEASKNQLSEIKSNHGYFMCFLILGTIITPHQQVSFVPL